MKHQVTDTRLKRTRSFRDCTRAFVCSGLILGLLSACQAKPLDPAPLETLREDIARLQTNLDTRADAEQEALVNTMNDNLAKVGNALDELSTRVSETCQVAVPTTCEPVPEAVLADTDKLIVGQVEKVWVDPPGFMISARVDTGAHSSSLHAENIVEFERDGADWVRFDVRNQDSTTNIERPVEKFVRVFQQSDKQGTRRAVVNMRIFLGNVKETFAFTLADRSHLQHGMILGRNFLTDIALVDVAREFVQPIHVPRNDSDANAGTKQDGATGIAKQNATAQSAPAPSR